MNLKEKKEQEIKTIKERNFSLNLSDMDMKRIYKKAASVGFTPEKLLEYFIGDLVDGTYSNGSDERMLANDWFERCDFSLYPDKTFLRYLVIHNELDDLLNSLEEKESVLACIADDERKLSDNCYKWENIIETSRECPEGKRAYNTRAEWEAEVKEYIEEEQEDLSDIEENINEIWNGFLAWTDKSDVNFDKEVER
ncbi:MAG: hypothetical protein Q4F97_12815, partial [Bacteroidales bacterium]|nr:hypothetical protein [Bacteroidales bacterium]